MPDYGCRAGSGRLQAHTWLGEGGAQEFEHLRLRHGPGEQETLNRVATFLGQQVPLFLGLDSLRDDGEAERTSKGDRGPAQCGIVGICRAVLDDGPIDLQPIHIERLQVPQCRPQAIGLTMHPFRAAQPLRLQVEAIRAPCEQCNNFGCKLLGFLDPEARFGIRASGFLLLF